MIPNEKAPMLEKKEGQSNGQQPGIGRYSRKSGIGAGEDQALLAVGHIHLLAMGCKRA
jgi:hypothetical protein